MVKPGSVGPGRSHRGLFSPASAPDAWRTPEETRGPARGAVQQRSELRGGAASAAQYGAIAALDGPEDHLKDMMKEFSVRRKLMVEGLRNLKGIDCNLPGGSFFAFPNVAGTGMNGEEFSNKCLNEAGVATIPGTAFGKYATDNVRFNFATSRENISKAIQKIDKILK